MQTKTNAKCDHAHRDKEKCKDFTELLKYGIHKHHTPHTTSRSSVCTCLFVRADEVPTVRKFLRRDSLSCAEFGEAKAGGDARETAALVRGQLETSVVQMSKNEIRVKP